MATTPEPGDRIVPDPAPRSRRRPVVSFALWDGGMSAFSSVILTFVFATYVASAVASEGAVGEEAIKAAQDHGSQVLTTWQSIGAVAIALLAPLLGNLADRGGVRNTLLRVTTLATVLVVALMPLVALDADDLVLGAALIALAVVFSELAGVFVNSVLPEVSTPENRGRISGTAWAVGYWGSIVCLGAVLVLFVMPGTGLLGITGDDGWNFRAIPLFVALWILLGTLPLMIWAPKHPATAPAQRWTPLQGYASIVRRVIRAFREEPVMLQYLVASAIYRDGLGAVFSIAGVLAANAYGFSTVEIIIFGIAANLVAGIGVFLGGRADDRMGTRWLIIAGCLGIIVLGLVVLAFGSSSGVLDRGPRDLPVRRPRAVRLEEPAHPALAAGPRDRELRPLRHHGQRAGLPGHRGIRRDGRDLPGDPHRDPRDRDGDRAGSDRVRADPARRRRCRARNGLRTADAG